MLTIVTWLGAPGPGDGVGPGSGMQRGGDMARRGLEMGHDHGDHSWWMFAIVVVFAIALIGLLVWAVIATTRAITTSTGGSKSSGGPTAREILDQRLAQGDISAEDYEARKKLLGG